MMTTYPAYLIKRSPMRPITRIRLFNIRLAVVVLAGYWLAMFLGTHLPVVPGVAAGVSDKTQHFVAYFGLTLLLCYVTTSPPSWRRFGTIAVVAAGYGVLDELAQLLVPGRHADLRDLLADSLGIAAAIAVYSTASVLYRYYQRTSHPSAAS